MECLIKGCNFLLKNISNECYEFRQEKCAKPKYIFQNLDSRNIFPYLLVNIGSGVSILKVDSETQYERVGGTSTGGGTFWGLGSLLTNAKGFDELLELASRGQSKNVDMLVKDIYGGDYAALGLPGDLVASSFGKTVKSSEDPTEGATVGTRFEPKDIAKSLLFLISNDIGQISSLYANLYGLTRIFFGGYFIRGHPTTMHTITFAVDFFSKGKQKALFLRHEGYLGAVGAFLKGAEKNAQVINGGDVTWGENYATSSGLSSNDKYRRFPNLYDVLELDKFTHSLAPCPLLADPSGYKPDLENLGTDEEAREYWLNCFEKGIDLFVEQAVQSQSGQSDVKERGNKFREEFFHRLKILRKNPFSFGELTVRNLMDTREQFLNEFWFSDPYLQVKQHDNEVAMKVLPARLSKLDTLSWRERQVNLVEGLLAGNVIDWGAQAAVKEMKDSGFNFAKASEKIQKRPWLQDDVDLWIKRLEGKPHKQVVIFVDNSGGDIILGIFPFARELLQRGTKVILAANSYPAINDVIHSELVILGDRVAEICPTIRTALAEQQLVIMETGLGSPCLDLRRIHISLVDGMRDADLILLEGLGRSIHTNYSAKFTCDAIKLAVLKNPWIAKKFGGHSFDVLFRFESRQDKAKNL